MTLCSLDGSELLGEKLVRLVYLDESGIGNIRYEPITVVAGVIVPADAPATQVTDYLGEMVRKYVPEQHWENFRFHSKELTLGGKVLSRFKDEELRTAILEELCSIPKKFQLPIVFGYFRRELLENPTIAALVGKNSWKKKVGIAHAMAAYACVLQVELFMRTKADSNERASLIFETNTDTQRAVDFMMRYLRKGENPFLTTALDKFVLDDGFPIQPIRRIQEEHWFASKQMSTLLQLADVCANTIRRRVTRGHGDKCFELLEPCLIEGTSSLLRIHDELTE